MLTCNPRPDASDVDDARASFGDATDARSPSRSRGLTPLVDAVQPRAVQPSLSNIASLASALPPGTEEISLSGSRTWDRQAAADFLVSRFAQLRRRVQRRLQSHGADVADADDVLATSARKLDALVSAGRVLQAGEGRMWALICRVVDRSTIDLIRWRASNRRVQRRLFDFAGERPRADSGDASGGPDIRDFESASALLDTLNLGSMDRELLSLRCRGVAWPVAAELLGQTPEAIRKRWTVVCERLREAVGEK